MSEPLFVTENEQPDDHLSQLARANGNSKAPADNHAVTHTQTVSGPTIDNRNQLSTPVMLGFLIVIAAMCLGLTIVGVYAGSASTSATNAERNAKLAQYQMDEAIKKFEERLK